MSEEYVLKHPGHCSGMFWRGNPITGKRPGKGADWPRNGAVLRGTKHVLDKKVEGTNEWLQVDEFKQAGKSEFVKVPENTWMQFQQGGLLLHKQ